MDARRPSRSDKGKGPADMDPRRPSRSDKGKGRADISRDAPSSPIPLSDGLSDVDESGYRTPPRGRTEDIKTEPVSRGCSGLTYHAHLIFQVSPSITQRTSPVSYTRAASPPSQSNSREPSPYLRMSR
jgi:hypothetical protein